VQIEICIDVHHLAATNADFSPSLYPLAYLPPYMGYTLCLPFASQLSPQLADIHMPLCGGLLLHQIQEVFVFPICILHRTSHHVFATVDINGSSALGKFVKHFVMLPPYYKID
jgi:hypothetical protein